MHSTDISKDLVLECKYSEMVKAIRADDTEKFSDELSKNEKTDFPIEFTNDGDIPWILSDEPTPLMLCAVFGSSECFTYLMLNGCDVKRKDSMGRSIIHFAAAGGNMDIIRSIDQSEADLSETDSDGNCAAHFAAKFAQNDVFMWLWSRGMPINPSNNNGATPMMWAAGNGNIKLMKFLIEKEEIDMSECTNGVILNYFHFYI